MTVDNLHRVLWRVRRNNPNKKLIPWIELKRSIMYECGTNERTYKSNRKALVDLGWIRTLSGKNKFELTDNDL